MANRETYVESLRRALRDVMRADPLAIVLGEDILDPYGGAFKVTRGLSTEFPGRVFTTPICEATIVGVAVGLALRGFHPVAEIMFGDFVTLAADQIINHAAKYHDMYNGAVDVPLVIRTPMGGGRGYGPTHSQSLEKLFFGIPQLKVVSPSHFHDAGGLLAAAVADPAPVLFIEDKLLYPMPLKLAPVETELTRYEIGAPDGFPCVILKNYAPHLRPDVTVIAYGGISRLLEPLSVKLAQEEIRVIACLPGCLSPLVSEPLLECARETDRVVIVEPGQAGFGWGAEVAARVYDALYDSLAAPIKRVGALPTVIPAAKHLEQQALVSEETILAAILEVMR